MGEIVSIYTPAGLEVSVGLKVSEAEGLEVSLAMALPTPLLPVILGMWTKRKKKRLGRRKKKEERK